MKLRIQGFSGALITNLTLDFQNFSSKMADQDGDEQFIAFLVASSWNFVHKGFWRYSNEYGIRFSKFVIQDCHLKSAILDKELWKSNIRFLINDPENPCMRSFTEISQIEKCMLQRVSRTDCHSKRCIGKRVAVIPIALIPGSWPSKLYSGLGRPIAEPNITFPAI